MDEKPNPNSRKFLISAGHIHKDLALYNILDDQNDIVPSPIEQTDDKSKIKKWDKIDNKTDCCVVV